MHDNFKKALSDSFKINNSRDKNKNHPILSKEPKEIASIMRIVDSIVQSKIQIRKLEIATKIKGEKGERGEIGPEGPIGVGVPGKDGEDGKTPNHQWEGKKLQFERPDGAWGELVNLEVKSSSGPVKRGGGASHFRLLLDAPSSYSGQSGKVVAVKSTEDGVEFTTLVVGDVFGPSSSTNNAIVRFDGTTGKLIQNYTSNAPTITDTGTLSLAIPLALTSGGTGSTIGSITGSGHLNFVAGNDGKLVRLLASEGITGNTAGGAVVLTGGAGTGSGIGGGVFITGGAGSGVVGGDIALYPGAGTPDGLFLITDPSSSFEVRFDTSLVSANRTYTFPNATGTFYLTGSDMFISDSTGLIVGHSSQVVAGEVTSEMQVLGTSETDGSQVIYLSSTTDALSPQLKLVKSASGTIGTETTTVADNEELGKIQAYGSDGTDADTLVAEIGFFVDDSSVAAGQIGGELVLSTATSGGTLTPALTISSSQNITTAGNIISDTDATDDLGSSSVFWANAFIDKITMRTTGVGSVGTAQTNAAIIIDTAERNNVGISILQPTNANESGIFWSDSGDDDVAKVTYSHNVNTMFFNTAGGARITLDSTTMKINDDLQIDNGHGFRVGHTSFITTAGEITPEIQFLGTAATDSSVMIYLSSTTDALSPTFKLVKSANSSIGSHTTSVADNEELGKVQAYGSDGTNADTLIAEIGFFVDDASVATGQIGGEIIFSTATSGGTLTTAMRIDSNGSVHIDSSNTTGATHSLSFIPTGVLGSDALWHGIHIDGSNLDPSGTGAEIEGLEIDFSGVSLANNPLLRGLEINMPFGNDALHIENGKFHMDVTTPSTALSHFAGIDVDIDSTLLAATSDYHVLDISVVGFVNGEIEALHTNSNVTVIHQTIGSFSTPSQTEFAGRKTGGGATWVDGIDTIEFFVVDNDEIYLGSSSQFAQIEVIMSSDATKDTLPTFWYNTAADTWTEFFPMDGTDGFQDSGIIAWDLSSITGAWTNNGDPGAGDTTAGYWIKVIRNRVADPGTPTATTMKTGTTIEYTWDKTGALNVKSITIGGLTVTLADAGEDAIFGWDDTASEYSNLTQAEVLAVIGDSSTTAKGVVELATIAETDTGTSAVLAVTPDGFQGSLRNIRWLVFNLVEAGTDCATATNIAGDFLSPIAGVIQQSDTTPFYLYATNSTAGVTGTMVVDVSIGGTTIMTSNKLDFDTGEKTTTTAATPPDLTTTALAVGDIITIDIDSIHTTAAKGLTVYIAVLET